MGSLLFILVINLKEFGIESTISVFADGTKPCRGATSLQDVSNLKGDLNGLFN